MILVCPKNQYKSGSNSRTSCSPCPAHSHTASTGSNDVKMCLCDGGYRGNPGGPCTGDYILHGCHKLSQKVRKLSYKLGKFSKVLFSFEYFRYNDTHLL